MSSKKPTLIDPFAEREAKKYDKPIASRELIMQYLAQAKGPVPLKKLQEDLGLYEDETQNEALLRRLRAMERAGQVIRTRRGGYGLPKKMNLIKGQVIAHPDGYGFLVPETGGEDLFLSEKQMRNVLHGDRVMVSVVGIDHRGRREGAIAEVLERNTHQVVGRFRQTKHGITLVEPANRRFFQDIVIPTGETGGVQHGQMVVVELLNQPDHRQPLVGKVIEVLGEHLAPGMEIEIAIRDHELPYRWSEEVLKEVAPLKRQKKIPAPLQANRVDFRRVPLVTIDGEDARDFDDAVFCEPHGKGWRLLVAIADVSAYVKPGTLLDEAAQERGNSVYFPDRVIPMLPEILSTHWCSLNPQVDRLCLVCELLLTKQGGVRQSHFYQGIMRSAARLTYTQVGAALAGDETAVPAEALPQIHNLYQLYQILRQRREKRGAIDFETIETRIIFDAERKIESIVPLERNEAYKLIEEMMLAANVATAEWLTKHGMAFLYRVHEGPDAEKLTQLRSFLGELGLRLYGGDKPKSVHYAKVLAQVQQRPDRHLIQTVLLRSLRMAIYTPENIGHFGLAYESYTHFTSPIRRYPDLLAHRAICHVLQGRPSDEFPYSQPHLQGLGSHCSMTERRADEATRDAIEWLKCEYMRDKIGEIYPGVITGVTSFGLFIELEGIFIEGLAHISTLYSDYYHFDPSGHRLYGERTGKVYRLADKVRVKVMRVGLEERKIDFELVG